MENVPFLYLPSGGFFWALSEAFGHPNAERPEENGIVNSPVHTDNQQEEGIDVVGLDDEDVLERGVDADGNTRFDHNSRRERKSSVMIPMSDLPLLHLNGSPHQTLGWTGDSRLPPFAFLLIILYLLLAPMLILMLLFMLPFTLSLSFLFLLLLTLLLTLFLVFLSQTQE